MSEVDIAPLAKRLAEENNVNWRKLEGSGPDGRVVERDVLEYLAKVMTGEEAVNPTEEPLPEGLAAWPGGSAPQAVQLDAELSEPSQAAEPAFDDDLLEMDTAESEPVEAAPPASLEEADISEDIFLFEPEEDEAGEVAVFSGEEEPAAPAVEDDAEWLLEEPQEAAGDAGELLIGDAPPELDPEPPATSPAEVPVALEERAPEATTTTPAAEEDDDATPTPVPDAQRIPLVSYGLLLRRHLDLTALAEAQLAIGHEFADGKPLPPTAFLVRAAAKTLQSVPLASSTSVGLAVISEHGVGARQLADAATGSFLQLLSSVTEAQASEDTAIDGVALVVADMSDFEVDEAVLNVGVPVLTLGRLLYDSTQGSYRSTLSLSGEFSAEQGAKFLGHVTELLNTPVRLVL